MALLKFLILYFSVIANIVVGSSVAACQSFVTDGDCDNSHSNNRNEATFFHNVCVCLRGLSCSNFAFTLAGLCVLHSRKEYEGRKKHGIDGDLP